MKRTTLTLVLLFVLTGAAFAGPFRREIVAAGAKWIVHADVERFRGTRVGEFILKQLESVRANNKLAAFQAVFNFDPRKDVDSLTLYGPDNDEKKAIALISGAFDAERLTTLLRSVDGHKAINHGKHVLHYAPAQEHSDGTLKVRTTPSWWCFHGGGIVVSGTGVETTKAAIDVLDGKRPSLLSSRPFENLSLPTDAAFLMAITDLDEMAELSPQAVTLQETEALRLVVRETGDNLVGSFVLVAKSPQTAIQVQAVVQGMIAVTMLGAQDKPELVKLAQAARVSLSNSTVEVKVRYATADMITLLEKQTKEQTAEEEEKPAAPLPQNQ